MRFHQQLHDRVRSGAVVAIAHSALPFPIHLGGVLRNAIRRDLHSTMVTGES
jgi:hypothetical protein